MAFTKEYFDEGIYRMGTRCEKWDELRQREGGDILPLWVADMDFPSPPAVQQALLARAAHGTYGYTEAEADDYQALIDFWARRHEVTFTREDVMMIPCVVTGIRLSLLALTQPGDGVIIQSPVYGPFRFSVQETGRKVLDNPLIRRADGGYDMDFDHLETLLQQGAKAMILCSPHNPVSRLWRREELEKLLALLGRYGVPLIADEIHADFVYAPEKFVSCLKLEAPRMVTLCAASKTFNLAGLQQASLICRDAETRQLIQSQMNQAGVRSGNIFALEATRAAYQHGDEWLDALLGYLDGNRRLLAELVREHLPQAVLTPMEATYLGWLDLRAYGHDNETLMKLTHRAGVAFTGGAFFGQEAGDGFLRINIGCPARYVEEGILRLKVALETAE